MSDLDTAPPGGLLARDMSETLGKRKRLLSQHHLSLSPPTAILGFSSQYRSSLGEIDNSNTELEQGLASVEAALLPSSTSGPNENRGELLDSEKKWAAIVDSLRAASHFNTRYAYIKDAQVGTCEWLLSEPKYLAWLDSNRYSDHHGLFWIKGKAGCGKSTLMKFAINSAQKHTENSVIASFFFNFRGGSSGNSAHAMYQSLSLQFIEQYWAVRAVPVSLDRFKSSIRKSRRQDWDTTALEELLKRLILGLQNHSAIFFIDALDECEEDQARKVLVFFVSMGHLAASAGIRFRVCLSSRYYPHISVRKGIELCLDQEEGHSADIARYIQRELKIREGSIAEQIRSELQDKSSGMFYWVVLTVFIINKEYDRGRFHSLLGRLREVTTDLEELFHDIITRNSSRMDDLVICIQWVLYAREPLSLEQLYFAVLSGTDVGTFSEWNCQQIPTDDIRKFILDCSMGLVEMTQSNSVRFIHQSVADFIQQDKLKTIRPDLVSNFQGLGHERLKYSCISYLGIRAISSQVEQWEHISKAPVQEIADWQEAVERSFPFLEYAVKNVLYHADMAAKYGIPQDQFLSTFPLSRWIKLSNLLEKHANYRYTSTASLLYILAERNLSNLVKLLSAAFFCLSVEQERYGTPLFAALATNSQEAVHTFGKILEISSLQGFSLQGKDSESSSRKDVSEVFNSSFRFSHDRDVLSCLAEYGDTELFGFALTHVEAAVDSKDHNGLTSLHYAAIKGHVGVARLLLRYNADVNAQDLEGRTPLWMAADKGHKPVTITLLRSIQTNVNIQDFRGQTPLLKAAEKGHMDVVECLLNSKEIDINMKDRKGWTPLSAAARWGHEQLVRLLLESDQVDASISIPDREHALSAAEVGGHEAVIKLLLDSLAEIDSQDGDGRIDTPLLAREGVYNNGSELYDRIVEASRSMESAGNRRVVARRSFTEEKDEIKLQELPDLRAEPGILREETESNRSDVQDCMSSKASTASTGDDGEATRHIEHEEAHMEAGNLDPQRMDMTSLTSIANLASRYRAQREWKKAEELDLLVMKVTMNKFGADHSFTLRSMTTLASTYLNQGRWQEAEELEEHVMESKRRTLGAEHPSTLTAMTNLASTYAHRRRWTEAEKLGRQVLETREKLFGETHPSTLHIMTNFAFTLKAQGRDKEGISLMERCYLLRKTSLGVNHPQTVSSYKILKKWMNGQL